MTTIGAPVIVKEGQLFADLPQQGMHCVPLADV